MRRKVIIFKLSFALAFSLKKPEKEDKSRKQSPVKSGQKVIIKPEDVQPEFDEQPRRTSDLEPGNYIGNAHIDYELLPKRFKYEIELQCWEYVYKVITPDGTRIMRTIRRSGKIWTFISMEHFLNRLSNEELFNLQKHVIYFNVATNKSSGTAKSETSRNTSPIVYYCLDEEVGLHSFAELYDHDINLNKIQDPALLARQKFENDLKRMLTHCVNMPSSDEVVSMPVMLQGNTHRQLAYDTLMRISQAKPVKVKDFVNVCPPTADSNKSKSIQTLKSKSRSVQADVLKVSKTTNTNKRPDSKPAPLPKDTCFIVSGEVFFTDPNMAVYSINEQTEIVSNGYLYITVTNLMTRTQKIELNPLVVKIKKLENLPLNILEANRFSTIHVKYEIPSVAKCTTIGKSVNEVIRFDESHVFFTQDIPVIKYLEFFLNHRFIFEIIGIKDEEEQKTHSVAMFGTLLSDKNLSKRFSPYDAFKFRSSQAEKHEISTNLAIASFDCSSVIRSGGVFREKGQCYNPSNSLYGQTRIKYDEFTDMMTINEQHLRNLFDKRNQSPLTEAVMMERFTTLEVEIYFSAPQFSALKLQRINDTFKRLVLVVYDDELATKLIKMILIFNEKLLGPSAIINHIAKDELSAVPETKRVLTGFVIDNVTEYIFYVEGPNDGYILHVWNEVHYLHPKKGSMYFNSESLFEKRLYPEFETTGVLVITMKQQLQQLFSKYIIYLEGNMPIPCKKALHKLHTMIECDTVQKMYQFNVFPEANELICLTLEFGVPFRWWNQYYESKISK